ncbi:sugar ABC transporter substrate-binding protein [Trinickia terrae]|uniref:Sugar ABC transporter substrate-binding protein n=1 Tax=Trinickia terrae TaxID=2571161 RepID=A0A4U1IC38_9BURK|nr:polysaccharide biosynthesis/export family protein [Trinickia terrae]TKC91164.1 sugar ABC transporter substrate-binding protein [Trinickia terrae]
MSFLNMQSRMLMSMTIAAVLSACSMVPGQRMITPPTVAQSGGEYSAEKEQGVPVPIADINLNLIHQLKASSTQQVSTETQTLFGKSGPYQIGPGDVLQITVWDHPELAAALGQPNASTATSDAIPGFLVDEQGNIQFPYAGSVHVAGENVAQIQRTIVSRISKVYKSPEVTVRVASFRSGTIYVDGEVRLPGALTVNDIPMTLSQAVGRAGGYTGNADQSQVELVRGDKTYPLNIAEMIRSGHNPNEIVLKNGDLVRVSSRDEHGVYLMGEVNKPATIMPMRNGTLTLAEALSQAGSLNPNTAEAKQLFVIRDSTGDNPQIYHLDATSPVSMVLANQFYLQPKDVVYVDNGALVKFNRVLNLFLPAINAGLTAAIVTK